MIDQILSYRLYDYKIELIDEKLSLRSRLYSISNFKFQKLKKYLIEHLNKRFILSFKAVFASLILFIKKLNNDLHFCIDYCKLNTLIKRDQYLISLIEKTLTCIQSNKYLT